MAEKRTKADSLQRSIDRSEKRMGARGEESAGEAIPSAITCRREYVIAKLAVRKQTRAIRDLYKRLLPETDPITYYSLLSDIFSAKAQLAKLYAEIREWETRGGCLVA